MKPVAVLLIFVLMSSLAFGATTHKKKKPKPKPTPTKTVMIHNPVTAPD